VPYALAAADVTSDGKLDLLATHGPAGWVGRLAGDGTGAFAAELSIGWTANPSALAAADLNGDGKPDYALADSSGHLAVYLFAGIDTMNPSGFNLPVVYNVGAMPAAIAVGDLNGDGKPDLVTANSGNDTLTPLVNQGGGTFAAAAAVPLAAMSQPVAVAIADLNGDGLNDLAAAGQQSASLDTFNGGANVTFSMGQVLFGGPFPRAVAVADFNHDGLPDVALANGGAGGVTILSSKSVGTLGSGRHFAIPGTWAMAVADLNGDGKPDLAVADIVGSRVRVFLNITP
jgi:hypothetical protein